MRALVRNTRTIKLNPHPNLQLISGGLDEDMAPHLTGVAAVIHVAAITDQHLADYQVYYEINYKATTRLTDAAIRAGISKFIYVSTANSIGYGAEPGSASEAPPMKAPFTRSFYARSKALAEQYVLRQQHRIAVHIVNPTFMIGPHDSKPSSGKIILMGMNNRVIFYPPGGKNFVAVKNVALAIEARVRDGKNGSRDLVAGENMTYKDFFKLLRSYTNRPYILLPVPRVLLKIAGLAGDLLRYCHINSSLSTVNMQILCIKNFYPDTTATTIRGSQYQSLRQAIAESIAYFKHTASKTVNTA